MQAPLKERKVKERERMKNRNEVLEEKEVKSMKIEQEKKQVTMKEHRRLTAYCPDDGF